MKEFLYKLLNLATLGRGMKRTINGRDVRLPTRFYRFFPDNYERDNFQFFLPPAKRGYGTGFRGTHRLICRQASEPLALPAKSML
ncbi:MAG: hypothetical protein IPJ02_14570 [Chitinophagaceae bacterium]|nr:hypothetical protein [Chitinophagaceae bacterium]